MEKVNLVDELEVVDSGSEDDTLAVAETAGAEIYRGRDVMPQMGHVLGKGEALWKSLAVTRAQMPPSSSFPKRTVPLQSASIKR